MKKRSKSFYIKRAVYGLGALFVFVILPFSYLNAIFSAPMRDEVNINHVVTQADISIFEDRLKSEGYVCERGARSADCRYSGVLATIRTGNTWALIRSTRAGVFWGLRSVAHIEAVNIIEDIFANRS